MRKLLFVTGWIAIIALAGIIGVQVYRQGEQARAAQKASAPAAARADLSSIVSLPNGAVLNAPKGSVGRDMVDWLASSDRSERYFELGGREYDGRSIEPTVESKVRIQRGIEILKANPDVSVEVIGFTASSGDPKADLALSQARADWVVATLHDGGIAKSRLSAQGRGDADPIADNATADGRAHNERIAMRLRHRH